MSEKRTSIRITRTLKLDTPQEKTIVLKGPGREMKIWMTQKSGHWHAIPFVKQERGVAHVKGVTRALFRQARKELQSFANENGKVECTVSAGMWPRMVDFFTKHSGKRVFPWKSPPVAYYTDRPSFENTAVFRKRVHK